MTSTPTPRLTRDEAILLAGDTHGDIKHCLYLLNMAEKQGIQTIFQLGDFGYWEHNAEGKAFLDHLARFLADHELDWYWLDGNHENHTLLRSTYPPRADGLVEIRPRLTYVPRATRWVWGGVQFLAIGGAYSIDKGSRIMRMDTRNRRYKEYGSKKKCELWWPEETITDDEVALCVDGGPVDVVLSHDVPSMVNMQFHFRVVGGTFFKADTSTIMNRDRLQRVFDALRPAWWFHGHYHIPYTERLDLCSFEGLDANVRSHHGWTPQGSWTIAFLDDLRSRSDTANMR